MSVFGWFLFSVSMLGCVWGWRQVFRGVTKEFNDGLDDIIAAGFIGLLLCWMWPFMALIGTLIRVSGAKDYEDLAKILGGRTRQEKQRDKLRARERAVEQRERYIQQLERSTGVGQYITTPYEQRAREYIEAPRVATEEERKLREEYEHQVKRFRGSI